MRLSRRKRERKAAFGTKGGGSVLIVGKRRIPDAFITRLANGRWHVMQRMPWASSSTGATAKGGRNATVCRRSGEDSTAGPLAETFERERGPDVPGKLPGADDESHDASVTPGAER